MVKGLVVLDLYTWSSMIFAWPQSQLEILTASRVPLERLHVVFPIWKSICIALIGTSLSEWPLDNSFILDRMDNILCSYSIELVRIL